MHKKLFTIRSGFSMVELMIVMAGLGAAALVGLQITKNTSMGQMAAQTRSNRADFKNAIEQTLSEGTSCTNSFGGILVASPISVTDIKDTLGAIPYTIGTRDLSKEWEIASMQLTAFTATTSATQGTSVLEITLKSIKAEKKTAYISKTSVVKIPLIMNVMIARAGAVVTTCSTQSGGDSSLWIANTDGIFYNDKDVTIGSPESPMGATLDLNLAGPEWYSGSGIFKSVEIESDNALVWEPSTLTPTISWGIGAPSAAGGLNVYMKTTIGRPGGVKTRMTFSDAGDIYIFPKAGITNLSGNLISEGPVKSKVCHAEPSGVCHETYYTNIFGKGYTLGGGIGINALTDSGGNVTTSFLSTGNAGAMILGDATAANGTLGFYTFPSTSTTVNQTIAAADVPLYERVKFDSMGNVKIGFTYGIQVSGGGSFAVGDSGISSSITKATGYSSFAQGYASQATGASSVAMGYGSIASGNRAVSIGIANDASYASSIAIGNSNISSSNYSLAMGMSSKVYGMGGTAIGSVAVVGKSTDLNSGTFGRYSTAIGRNVTTEGSYSTAMGYNTKTTADGSWAIGDSYSTTVMTNAVADSFNARFQGGYAFFTDGALSNTEAVYINHSSDSPQKLEARGGNFKVLSGENGDIGVYMIPPYGASNNYKIGFGNNIFFNRATDLWTATGDGVNSGGSAILSGYGTYDANVQSPAMEFYVVPVIGAVTRTFNNATMDTYRKMVLTAAGRLGIGTATPGYQLELSTNSAAKPSTNSWTIASDERLKDIKGDYTRGLKEILAIEPIYYSYKKGNPLKHDHKAVSVGIIAQEVMKEIPESVRLAEHGYYVFENDAVIWALVNAVKEQNKIVKSQDKKIKDLEVQFLELERRIKHLEKNKQ